VFAFLRQPVDEERRASLIILVSMRWVLIAAALFQVNYRHGTDAPQFAVLNVLAVVAIAFNLILHWRLSTRRQIRLYFPMLLGLVDVAAITSAIGTVNGFDNPSYILYYPALLSFVLVFPGKWSIVFTALVMGAYTATTSFDDSFEAAAVGDQKALVLRLATMATAALTANLVVRVERTLRQNAVAAEAERAAEVLAMEQRAVKAEREASAERARLSQEVHDGLSQNAYMLALGLEAAAETMSRDSADPRAIERMQGLVRLARQTLLETRNLLFDLERVMSGETSLAALVRNQAREFSTVSGIPVEVTVTGDERSLPPATVGEVFRVVQEGLANVYRHAKASNASVTLNYAADRLELGVADDGAGIPASEGATGHGLRNMRDRAQRLGGTLAIESSPGSGTAITLSIPFSEVPDGHPHPPG
jgi:signal transduction histidine kinase